MVKTEDPVYSYPLIVAELEGLSWADCGIVAQLDVETNGHIIVSGSLQGKREMSARFMRYAQTHCWSQMEVGKVLEGAGKRVIAAGRRRHRHLE